MRWLESNDLGLVLVALIGLIGSWFGGSRIKDSMTGGPPQAANPAPERTLEIAGAIVSDKAVEKMVASFDALKQAIDRDVEAKTKLTAALTESSHSLNRNSEVSEEMRDEIKETGSRLEGLTRELIRSGVRRHD